MNNQKKRPTWKLGFLLLFLTGCGQMSGCIGCTKKLPIIGQTEEERIAEEQALKKQAEENLKAADILVLKWATEVEKNGSQHHVEGLTDLDPWGSPITVQYRQEWFKEVATIRSNGPDKKPNTEDDLVRTRTYSNPSGIMGGISGFGWFCIVWLTCGILAFAASAGVSGHRRSSGKSGKHRHPIAFFLFVVILAPFALLIYGLQFIGGALGASGDFFDGFEFDFDIDIDIDIG